MASNFINESDVIFEHKLFLIQYNNDNLLDSKYNNIEYNRYND